MLFKIFAINDSKLGDFGNPFVYPHTGQAVRLLQDLVRDPKTVVAQHPADFRLYCLGTFDSNSGTFENLPAPEHLANAIDLTESHGT